MEYKIGETLECTKKHGLSERDIETAVRFAYAARYRNFDPPSHIAFAGPNGRGNLIEVLAAEQDDGLLIVYYAMNLTRKMADELGLI